MPEAVARAVTFLAGQDPALLVFVTLMGLGYLAALADDVRHRWRRACYNTGMHPEYPPGLPAAVTRHSPLHALGWQDVACVVCVVGMSVGWWASAGLLAAWAIYGRSHRWAR